MSSILSRRDFVGRALTAGTIAGLGDFAFLSRLRPVSADEAKPSKNMVQLTPEIEPLVEMAMSSTSRTVAALSTRSSSSSTGSSPGVLASTTPSATTRPSGSRPTGNRLASAAGCSTHNRANGWRSRNPDSAVAS